MKKLVISENFGYAYINGIYSPYFSILPLWLLRNCKSVKKIVAGRGMVSDSAIAIKSRKKKLFLSIAKFVSLYKDVTFHATNETEAMQIKNKILSEAIVKVAPNMASNDLECVMVPREKKSGALKMLNISRIAREKNIHYALEVLRHIKVKIMYDIYGVVYDTDYLEQCKQVIASLPENITVNLKGGIEKRLIQGCLHDYQFLLFPSAGENFGHVILEALSTGCPVIISDRTPWRDLTAQKAGWDIPLSDNKQFINVINFAAGMNQDEYNQWSDGATGCAKKFIDNRELKEMNKKLFTGTS